MTLVLAMLGAATATQAFAADDCVRVIGDEQSGEKMSMDPAFQPTNDDAYHLFGVYNRFLNVDDNLDPVPELATSWERSADGKQWTFKLQPGVKFHDGRDFGAKDVVYTFRRLIDPATASPAAVLLDFLKPDGIEAVDPLTVRFTMDKPIADLPLLLTLKFNLIELVADAEVQSDRARGLHDGAAEDDGHRHRPLHAGAVRDRKSRAHPEEEPQLLARRPAEGGLHPHQHAVRGDDGAGGDQVRPG
jgi:ABC-type transport system substrate-binding protein